MVEGSPIFGEKACGDRLDQAVSRHPLAPENMKKPNYLTLFALIGLCCVIEGTLIASELGAFGGRNIRQLTYDYGAFWPGLLDNWKPNYAAQPYLMFATYAVLHGGPIHLMVNMISLWSLGCAVLDRAGRGSFVVLYIGTSLTGAAFFAWLAPGSRPMVGASGSLFGLLCALQAWEFLERDTNLEGLQDLARFVLLLVALNFVLWWAMDGQLAWETHLGGALGGWAGAFLISRMQNGRG